MAPTDQAKFYPISELSAYQGKWTLRAKVTQKGQLRTFARRSGSGGDGKVFSVEITDGPGCEIKASFFDASADKYHELLQVGKVYTFTRGTVKVANRQYNSTKHRYEINFDRGAEIVETDADIDVGESSYDFVDLKQAQSRTLPARVDLCGIVTSYTPLTTLNSKDGRELIKRDITIADDTQMCMRITLWGDKGKMPDSQLDGNPVIALKHIVLKEWNGGRDGGSIEQTTLAFTPELPEAQRVVSWWTKGGSTQQIQSLGGSAGPLAARNAVNCNVSELRRQAEMVGEQSQWFAFTGRLSVVMTRSQGEPKPLHYVACAETKEGSSLMCNKRVDSSGICPSCARAGKTQIRLSARCKYADYTDACWLVSFHEATEKVLCMNADKLAELETNADGEVSRERLEATLKENYFFDPYDLTVRAQLQSYNGEPRTNTVCSAAAPTDKRKHGRKLMDDIRQMMAA